MTSPYMDPHVSAGGRDTSDQPNADRLEEDNGFVATADVRIGPSGVDPVSAPARD